MGPLRGAERATLTTSFNDVTTVVRMSAVKTRTYAAAGQCNYVSAAHVITSLRATAAMGYFATAFEIEDSTGKRYSISTRPLKAQIKKYLPAVKSLAEEED